MTRLRQGSAGQAAKPAEAQRAKVGARLIKAVQTCRRKVAGLADDEAWRDMLEQLTGKRSLRAMTNAELGAVLTALHAKGAPASAKSSAGRPRLRSDKPWVWKAMALWRSLHALGAVSDPSEPALSAFCKRQGCPEALAWLSPEQATKVIDALKDWCKREGFRLTGSPTIDRINNARALAGMEPVNDGWRAKLLLVHALLAKLPEAAGVAQLGDPPCATSDMTAAELDRAIEDLGAAVRRAKGEAS